jgi:hypothetical protein
MSITFHPTLTDGDVVSWEISCYEDEHKHSGQYSDYGAAAEAYRELLSDNQVIVGECLICPVWATTVSGAEVNMSASTAGKILAACGIESDQEEWISGSCDPTEMLSKLLAAGATIRSMEAGALVGATASRSGSTASEGILSRRHAELIDLCIVCIRLDRDVVWA